MLTYESIRKILDEEKATGRLTAVPENFFLAARDYLDKKAKTSEEEWRTESANRRLQDIIEVREKKIINSAVNAVKANIIPENMTAEEAEFFTSLVAVIKAFRHKVAKSMDVKGAFEVVASLQSIDGFVGPDMNVYGPFRQGDIATVPKPVAELLVKRGAAEKIEVKA